MMPFDSRSSTAALHQDQHQHQQHQQLPQHQQEQKLQDHSHHPSHHDPHQHHSPPLPNSLESSAMMTDPISSSFLLNNNAYAPPPPPPPQQHQQQHHHHHHHQPPVTVGLSAPGMPGGLSATAGGPQVAGTASAAAAAAVAAVSGAPMVSMGSHYVPQPEPHSLQQHSQHQQHPHHHQPSPLDPHHSHSHNPQQPGPMSSHPPMAPGMAPPSLSPLSLSTSPQRRAAFLHISGSAATEDGATAAAVAAAAAASSGRRRRAEPGQALVDQALGQGLGQHGLGPVGLGQQLNPTLNQGFRPTQGRSPPPSQQPRSSRSSGSSGSSGSSSSAKSSSATEPLRPQFSTQVDILMRTIQSRAEDASAETQDTPGHSFSQRQSPIHGMSHSAASPVVAMDEEMVEPVTKPYNCDIGECTMSFWQKTHLDIHKRSHTGEKPYRCSYSGCDAQFSQLGNLRTHERRHTGEKPFSCDRCGKFFAQRGNLKAHLKTHLREQPYECLLDSCKKRFTQLGNMKAHQNKYHANSLALLTTKFAQAAEGDEAAAASITPEDRVLFQHFADLYKNSNKGIKGRGKHRRVRPLANTSISTAEGLSSAPTVPEIANHSSRRGRGGVGRGRGGNARSAAGTASRRPANIRNIRQPDMQQPVSVPPPPPSQASQVSQHMNATASSGDNYMLYHPPLLHPIPPPPGAYGSSLGKLVNVSSANNSPVGTPGPSHSHGGGPGASDGAGGPYDRHAGQPSSLPPAPPAPALHPPQIPMNHQYGGPAPMGHSGMPSGQHPQHAAPQHPGHHMQSSHGGALHGQPMHGIGVPALLGQVPQHQGPSGPGGQHGHLGQMSHAAVVTRPSASTGFAAYDNEPVRNPMYNAF